MSTAPRKGDLVWVPRNNGPDGVISAGGFDDEPKQDVGDVNDPDGLFQRLELMRGDHGKRGTGRTP